MGLINWILNQPCATNGCTKQVSRWVVNEPVVIVYGETRTHWPNIARCKACQAVEEARLNQLPPAEARWRTSPIELGSGALQIR